MWRKTLLISAILMLCGAAGAALLAGGQADPAAPGNVRRLAIRDRVAGIDPLFCTGPGSASVAIGVNVFEPLFQYHHLRRPYTVIPCLAAALPEATEDALTWIIRIRDDVRFHDDPCFPDGRGRLVVADDVVRTLRRIADPRRPASAWPMLAGRIAGLDSYRSRLAEAAADAAIDPQVAGLAAIDERTLRIGLTRPWPQLAMVLAHPGTAVVPIEAVERYGTEFGSHAVGTGPYRLAAIEPNVRVELRRWDGWRGEDYPADGAAGDAEAGLLADAGRRMPFIDALEFTCVRADQPGWLLFMQGRLDAVGIPASSWSEVIGPDRSLLPAQARRGLSLETFPAVYSRWIGFNMADPLIGGNLPLRRAISLAIDREGFNRIFLSSRSSLPRGIIPQLLPEHRVGLDDPWMRFDPPGARLQVAEAERLHGGPLPELAMRFGGKGAIQRQIGDLIQRWFAEVGLRVRIDYIEEDALRASLRANPAHLAWGLGYSMRVPDPVDVLRTFRSGEIESNPFSYRNPEFDALYDRLVPLPPGEERSSICWRMEDLLLHDLPCVVMLDYTWVSLRHHWLRNRKPHAFYGLGGQAKYERIDTVERARWPGTP